jgi:hypothetical protein
MVKDKFVLSPDEAIKVRGWITSGRGVARWTNKDLSCMSRPDMVTPGDSETAPHWAYVGQKEAMALSDFEVITETVVVVPPEWFPECERCEGTGKRSIEKLADIRGESVNTVKFLMSTGAIPFRSCGDSEHFHCNSCDGCGHEISLPEFRVKRLPPYRGGGFEISKAGQAKAEKMARRLEDTHDLERGSVKWDWEHRFGGLGQVTRFFTETSEAFSI